MYMYQECNNNYYTLDVYTHLPCSVSVPSYIDLHVVQCEGLAEGLAS